MTQAKNDANQTHTDADKSTIHSFIDPTPPVIPARPAEIQSDPATAPVGSQSSSSSSASSHSSSTPEKPSAAKPKPSSGSSADHASSDKTDKDPSTDGNMTPSKSSGTQANDSSQSKDNQSSDGQTSNGLPVQNNGTSKTQSKTEQQPNSGDLPQTGDQAASKKAAGLTLAGLAMLGSAAFLKLKRLF